jgi:hypothetical protein
MMIMICGMVLSRSTKKNPRATQAESALISHTDHAMESHEVASKAVATTMMVASTKAGMEHTQEA